MNWGAWPVDLTTGTDPRFRAARRAVLALALAGWAGCLAVPVIAVAVEPRPLRQWLGAAGLLLVTAAFVAVLAALMSPAVPAKRGLGTSFVLAAALSVGLVAPVGAARWYTWAWVGGAVSGFAPLLLTGVWRWVGAGAGVALAVAVGAVTGGAPLGHGLIAASVAASVVLCVVLPFWLWTLLLDARAGREAQARLAVTQERLRFSRDVHDVLAHRLTVIALKAELAARLSAVDPVRAAQEAAQAQHLSAAALAEVREAVDGYRVVNLGDQLRAAESVLRDAGIRCTVRRDADDLPERAATELALVLREGCTNVLRHSDATWCTIEIGPSSDGVRLRMHNDGARAPAQDRHSFGLRGAAQRLGEVGGSLQSRQEEDVFMLDVTVPTT